MDTKFMLAVLSFLILGAYGSPLEFLVRKPPNCPYGKCFIDRCIRICSCVPKEGSISCTKEVAFFKSPRQECAEVSIEDGNCPLGKTYKDSLWPENVLCECNDDASQTYECFDLSTQTAADAEELTKSIKTAIRERQLAAKKGNELTRS